MYIIISKSKIDDSAEQNSDQFDLEGPDHKMLIETIIHNSKISSKRMSLNFENSEYNSRINESVTQSTPR